MNGHGCESNVIRMYRFIACSRTPQPSATLLSRPVALGDSLCRLQRQFATQCLQWFNCALLCIYN